MLWNKNYLMHVQEAANSKRVPSAVFNECLNDTSYFNTPCPSSSPSILCFYLAFVPCLFLTISCDEDDVRSLFLSHQLTIHRFFFTAAIPEKSTLLVRLPCLPPSGVTKVSSTLISPSHSTGRSPEFQKSSVLSTWWGYCNEDRPPLSPICVGKPAIGDEILSFF